MAPIRIEEKIDFDKDDIFDFQILYNTERNSAEVKSNSPYVLSDFRGTKRDSGYSLQVSMINPDYDR